MTSLLFPTGIRAQNVTPDSLSLQVYSDGSVDVEYVIEPDPLQAQVNVTLFGNTYQNVIVVDQNGIILDWELVSDGIQVDSLGSSSVVISYSTDSLTNKTGSQWAVSVNSPINPVFILPVNAVLVGLNPAPDAISFIDNQATISMPPGESSISYLIGTSGTKEHALALLNSAKDDVTTALDQNLIIDEAQSNLAKAIEAYQNGQYLQSEQYSTKVSESVKEVTALAESALNQINAAKSIIDAKKGKISTKIVSDAESLLDQAQAKYAQGDYSGGFQDAETAYTSVFNAPESQGGNNTLLYAGIVVVILAAAGYWYMNMRDSGQILQKPDTPQQNVDLNEVFKRNPHLRTDDKAVLRMLEETGGSFITEVRDRFDIPKSSAWRMARRLEEDGLILVTKIGRETYLQLKEMEEDQ